MMQRLKLRLSARLFFWGRSCLEEKEKKPLKQNNTIKKPDKETAPVKEAMENIRKSLAGIEGCSVESVALERVWRRPGTCESEL
jgi:hypothetical protein